MIQQCKKFFDKNKVIVIAGATALTGLIAYGFYFWSNKKISLSIWLERFAKHNDDLIKKENRRLTLELVAYMIHFISELEEFLFKQEFPELEEERINNLDNPNRQVYDELLLKTMEGQERVFHEACKLVEERFGYTMSDLKVRIEGACLGDNEWKDISTKCKFPYSNKDLPIVNRKELKEIYLEYSKMIQKNGEKISKLIMLVQKDPSLREFVMISIYNIKYRFKDAYKRKIKFEEKYIDPLIELDKELMKDPEIIEIKGQLMNLKLDCDK